MSPLKRFVALAALSIAVVAAACSTATAAKTPCWKTLINDWYDGRIDNIYAVQCYRDALTHLPQDVSTYSSARDDINHALQQRILLGPNGGGKKGGGGGTSPPSTSGRNGGTGPVNEAIGSLGPKDATSVPIPLIVLAGVAFLLLAAGSAGFVARRMRGRKIPPRPSPNQP
jgi:hypothetical protein